MPAVNQEHLRLALLGKGSMVGKYRIGRPLGRGGFGIVFEAYDTEDAVQVAIKIIEVDPGNEASRAALNRFHTEVEAICRIRHPNVVQVYETAVIPAGKLALAYYTMEILTGRTLEQVVKQDGPRPPAEALKMIRQAAAGLHRAHAEGIVHRDVKPGNIFLTAQGRAVVMDFGVCKLSDGSNVTLVGQVVGTPRYLAPEQMLDGTVDARTDVFALGALLFYLLTGEHLRAGADVRAVFHAVNTDGDVRRARAQKQLPEMVRDVLCTALARTPDDRFPSARAMAETLEATELLLGPEPEGELGDPGDWEGDNTSLVEKSDTTAQDLALQTLGGSVVKAVIVPAGEDPSHATDPAFPAVAPAPAAAAPPAFHKPLTGTGLRTPGGRAAGPPVVAFCPQCGARLAPDTTLDAHLEVCRGADAPEGPPPAQAAAPRPANTDQGLLSVERTVCQTCGADFPSEAECDRHRPTCPGLSWQQRNFAVAPAGAAPPAPSAAAVGLELVEVPAYPALAPSPDDVSLELDISGSNSKARMWLGRELRGDNRVSVEVGALYAAANRLKDAALGRQLGSALDLLAPLSQLVHDFVQADAAFREAVGRVLAVARRMAELATLHDTLRAQPRRQTVARLEARLRELTSGKQLEDRELVRVVRQQLEAARAQEKQLDDALGQFTAAHTVLKQMQEPLQAITQQVHVRGARDPQSATFTTLRQLEAAVLPASRAP